MIIGHIPAGYITSKLLFPIFSRFAVSEKKFLFWGTFGAYAPDLDMFWFYLVDHRQHHHHRYLTHYPILWLGLLVLSALWMKWKPSSGALALIFAIGGMGHTILDTLVGDIWWFAPFIDKPFSFFTVQPRLSPWWLSFILHWSFSLEVLLVAIAVRIWRDSAKYPAAAVPGIRPAAIK